MNHCSIVCLGSFMDIKLSGKRHALTAIRHWLFNFSIAFSPTILLLVLIEIIFRAVLFYGDVKVLNAFKNIGQESYLGDVAKPVTLRQMIRHSNNPRIIYELIPNISVLFMNKPVTINSHGFRGSQYNAVKGDKIIRIVGLGDSLMFGWGWAMMNIILLLFRSTSISLHLMIISGK